MIKNKIQEIDDTHAAVLTGDAILSDSDTEFNGALEFAVDYPPESNIGTTETIIATCSVAIDEVKNVVVATAVVPMGTDTSTVTLRVRETNALGAILGSIAVSTAAASPSNYHTINHLLTVVAQNVGTGITQLVLTRQTTSGSGSFVTLRGQQFACAVVDLEDTYAANLTGSAVSKKTNEVIS